jgi:hypothetical protein
MNSDLYKSWKTFVRLRDDPEVLKVDRYKAYTSMMNDPVYYLQYQKISGVETETILEPEIIFYNGGIEIIQSKKGFDLGVKFVKVRKNNKLSKDVTVMVNKIDSHLESLSTQ